MSAKAVARGVGQTIKWIVIAAFALVAVIIIVALVGLGKAANDADVQSTNVAAHVSEVKLGMTIAEVKAILGKPDSTQHFVSSYSTSDDLYYGTLSAKGSWQFDFEDGLLTAKNQY